MKVIHITATHLNSAGGIPVVLKSLVEEQNKLEKMDAMVVSLNADVSHLNSRYFVHVNLREIEDFLKKEKPEIAIIHSFFHLEYSYVAQLLYKNHIKYYIEPHGSFMKAGMNKSRIKKTIANATVFRKLINRAYGYIYLNSGEQQRSLYHTSNDVIIPNGISYYKNTPSKSDTIKMYYIGRYDIHEKGIDTLIEALIILDKLGESFTFDFFGDGSKENIDFIVGRTTGLENIVVQVHGPIYGDEKDGILSQYNISVLLSRHEGLPMTILESWNYGNPCIVTPDTNMANEAQTGKIGWSVELDAEKVAAIMSKAMCDYKINKDRYIERCRKHICSKYLWSQIAERSYVVLNPEK